jgi:hypothetical protein
MLLQPRPSEETAMNLQQQLHGDGIAGTDMVDAEDHGVDVSEHLNRVGIGGIVPQVPGSFCAQEAASTDLQPLDPRRGDGLCPQEYASQRLSVYKARGRDV